MGLTPAASSPSFWRSFFTKVRTGSESCRAGPRPGSATCRRSRFSSVERQHAQEFVRSAGELDQPGRDVRPIRPYGARHGFQRAPGARAARRPRLQRDHPLFLFNDHGGLRGAAKLRGNVSSADDRGSPNGNPGLPGHDPPALASELTARGTYTTDVMLDRAWKAGSFEAVRPQLSLEKH